MAAVELIIRAKRHKGGTWSVYITYPDGSYEHNRGLVDDGHAAEVIWHAIQRVEFNVGNQSVPTPGFKP